MPVRVRIKDFQSIKKAEILIEGLSVITGTNNSGKTAVMRAVRGVFTNPPAGPLVRKGEAHLSVELVFGDGTTILWEKGWETPARKTTVNRYKVNGVSLPLAGRGAPPEVAALGVCEIQASSDRVWPQIAPQFTGSLFLVHRSGAAVAEALSDVDKVGRLTKALKLSEKDRRSTEAELRVRRKDVKAHKEAVAHYDGLDPVSEAIGELVGMRAHAQELSSNLQVATGFQQRWAVSAATVEALRGFSVELPETVRAVRLSLALRKALELKGRHEQARKRVEGLSGFSVSLPASQKAESLLKEVVTARSLLDRHKRLKDEADALGSAVVPGFPNATRANKVSKVLSLILGLQARHVKCVSDASFLVEEHRMVLSDLALAEIEVQELLGDRGFCPTCKTVHHAGMHS